MSDATASAPIVRDDKNILGQPRGTVCVAFH